jgi:adenosylcobyric acid synthase
MGFAIATQTPVILVADIDRGGVIASIVGTWELLPGEERALISGYIINKFRGDASLFASGIEVIKEKTGLLCFGIIPYVPEANKLPQEDAHTLANSMRCETKGEIKIIVLNLAHISNYDDFDPLIAEPDVELQFINRGEVLPSDADLVILPGSKTTIADLTDLRQQGWDIDLRAHVRRGGHVWGVCAGYQMLGTKIKDTGKLEGDIAVIDGLGLLDVQTEMGGDKKLVDVSGISCQGFGEFRGYEMHIGQTTGPDCDRPFSKTGKRYSGAISGDGKIMGCYVHGLFSNDSFRHAILSSLKDRAASGVNYAGEVEDALDLIAIAFEKAIDIDKLLSFAD